MAKTEEQFDGVAASCRAIFAAKLNDYGTNWRIMRTPSLTDQLMIKAKRIRSIEEKGVQMVGDSIASEYMAIFNYALMALIQCDLGPSEQPDMNANEALEAYDRMLKDVRSLMLAKNHDYGEAWRDMRTESLTDMILQKLLRIKEIERNDGKVLVSEGTEGNYQDIVNYAAFALIQHNDKPSSL